MLALVKSIRPAYLSLGVAVHDEPASVAMFAVLERPARLLARLREKPSSCRPPCESHPQRDARGQTLEPVFRLSRRTHQRLGILAIVHPYVVHRLTRLALQLPAVGPFLDSAGRLDVSRFGDRLRFLVCGSLRHYMAGRMCDSRMTRIQPSNLRAMGFFQDQRRSIHR